MPNRELLSGRPQVQCLVLALLSFLIVAAWQELVIHYHYQGNQTALFCTGSRQTVPAPIRAGTWLFPDSFGYDGQFYRYLAHDPFFQRGFARNMDDARHRTQRILVPFIAWAVSAGRDGLIDRAYQYTVAAFCGLGVYWTCSYIVLAGCPLWWGMPVFLLLPATLTSIDRMLVDGALCALFAGYLYYVRRGRWRPLYVVALLSPLVRDTGYLLAGGLILASVLERRWQRAALFATAAVPALLWECFVAAHTGPTGATSIFGKPVIGLLERLFTFRHESVAAYPQLQGIINAVNFLAILGYILCLAIAAVWLWSARKKEGWNAPGIAVACFLLLGLALGNQNHLIDAYGYARPLSPLILWVVLRALATRAWAALIPPVLVAVGVGIYLAPPTFRVAKGLLNF
jgi:hypothetical protein